MKYRITCLKCKGNNDVSIEGDRIFWDRSDRIISGRKRLDNEWGWQCICGNNSLLTKQEERYISNKQNPHPKEIAEIVKNLVTDKRKLFEMTEA